MVAPAPDAERRLRLAFVGCGAIADWHLAALRAAAPRIDVTAAVDVDGDRAQAVGKVGGGIEHRFTPRKGIFADAAWMFSEHENAAVFRVGMSFAFGPGEPPHSPSYKK